MSHSWERITLPFPWVTHGKELHHLHLGLLRMPKSRQKLMCKTYQGKALRHLPQRDIPEI